MPAGRISYHDKHDLNLLWLIHQFALVFASSEIDFASTNTSSSGALPQTFFANNPIEGSSLGNGIILFTTTNFGITESFFIKNENEWSIYSLHSSSALSILRKSGVSKWICLHVFKRFVP